MYEGFSSDCDAVMSPDAQDTVECLARLSNLFGDREDDGTRSFLLKTFEDKGMSHEDAVLLVDWEIWTYRFDPYSND